MIYYTEDGQPLTEAEAQKLGNYLVFRDEEAAVAAFDKRAAEAQERAKRDHANTTGPLARFATGIVGRQNPVADSQIELERKLAAGEISQFEFRKAMDALHNPPTDLE